MTQKNQPQTPNQPQARATPAQNRPTTKPKVRRRRKKPQQLSTEVTELLELDGSGNAITVQDAQFLAEYLKNGSNAVRAVQAVWPGIDYHYATVKATRILKRVQGATALYMDRRGLTLDRLVDVLNEGLIATQPVVVKHKTFHENGRRKEESEDVAYADDFKTRQRYLETALKLRGELAKSPEIIMVPVAGGGSTGRNNSISLSDLRPALDEIAKGLMAATEQQLIANDSQNNKKTKQPIIEAEVAEYQSAN